MVRFVVDGQVCGGRSDLWCIVRFVVDGQVCGGWPGLWWIVRFVMDGQVCGGYNGHITNLNMFSSSLSWERMERMTGRGPTASNLLTVLHAVPVGRLGKVVLLLFAHFRSWRLFRQNFML